MTWKMRQYSCFGLVALASLFFGACASTESKNSMITRVAAVQVHTTANTMQVSRPSEPSPLSSPYKTVRDLRGKASWYSIKTNHGTATASGERLSNSAMTAAHKTLPMGTRVRVTNLRNGKSLILRINDRGPYIRGRIIDVTIGAAKKLGMLTAGVVPAKVEVLEKR